MLDAIVDEDIAGIVALMNRAYRGTKTARSWNSESADIAGDRTTESCFGRTYSPVPELRS